MLSVFSILFYFYFIFGGEGSCCCSIFLADVPTKLFSNNLVI